MSCQSATSPIDIIQSNTEKCDLKCSVTFNYKTTSVRAENKGDFIRLGFDSDMSPPVIYNTQKYNVQEARIYQPSLHTYGGNHTLGEMLIVHQNQSMNDTLIVCIPITETGNSSGVLDNILNQISQKANTKGGITNISGNTFSLKQLVPQRPFYSYTGTLPYSPCNGKSDYIVFGKQDAISILNSTIINIKQIINASNYTTRKPIGGLFYNSSGPGKGGVDGDDIYIECSPTGEEGNVLIKKPKNSYDSTYSDALEKLKNNGVLIIIAALIILFIIVKIFDNVISKLSEK